jgi:hypothetical protein
LRKVVNMSTKRTARARMYNMTDIKLIRAYTPHTTSGTESCINFAGKQTQGVKVIAMALMRHNTCSWYVGKAKNQAMQWMPPKMVAISHPESRRTTLSESSSLMLPSNVGTRSFRDEGMRGEPISSTIGTTTGAKIPSSGRSSLSSSATLRQT